MLTEKFFLIVIFENEHRSMCLECCHHRKITITPLERLVIMIKLNNFTKCIVLQKRVAGNHKCTFLHSWWIPIKVCLRITLSTIINPWLKTITTMTTITTISFKFTKESVHKNHGVEFVPLVGHFSNCGVGSVLIGNTLATLFTM